MTIDYRKEVEEYRAGMTEAERMEKYMKGGTENADSDSK